MSAGPGSAIIPMPLLRALTGRSCIEETVLREAAHAAGLSPAWAVAPVGAREFSALYRELALRMDDEMPGMFSRPVRGGTLKFLCRLMLDAPSLQVALHRAVRFARLVLDDFTLELLRDGGCVQLALLPRGRDDAGGRRHALGQQLLLKLLHGLLCWLTGRQVPMHGVHFAFPRGAFVCGYLYAHCAAPQFDRPASAFGFEAALLALPVRRSRRDLDAFLAQAPHTWLFALPLDTPLRERIRQHLAGRLQTGAGVDEVARALHLSVRTLCRRLDSEGTSFQAIKDELRCELAIEHLTRSRAPVAAIAAELGYGDPNSFYRAFRSWSGVTPGAYRRGLEAKGS